MRELLPGPPKGFRPTIPVAVKGDVLIRQAGKCQRCGESLGSWKNTQFNHNPPIQGRIWCAETGDTVPPANSAEHIEAQHVDCHKAVTTGRRGASRLSIRGGDVQEIAKTRRLAEQEQEFRQRLLARETGETAPPDRKPKRKIPSRPFARRPKHGSKTSRRETLDAGDGGQS